MIIDSIQQASRYFGMHPLFEKAFRYLEATDWNTTPVGTYDIAEGLKVIFTEGSAKTQEESLKKFECHDHYLDIQVCLRGKEAFGWKPRSSCQIPNGEYNPEKDVRFFSDMPDMYFELNDGQFVILYPEDVHAPLIGEGVIKKLVFKVKI